MDFFSSFFSFALSEELDYDFVVANAASVLPPSLGNRFFWTPIRLHSRKKSHSLTIIAGFLLFYAFDH